LPAFKEGTLLFIWQEGRMSQGFHFWPCPEHALCKVVENLRRYTQFLANARPCGAAGSPSLAAYSMQNASRS